MVLLFPDVFSAGGNDTTMLDEPTDLSSFTRLIHSGAGAKNGTRTEIRATPVKEYLVDCQWAAEQAKQAEQDAKKKH